MLEIDGSFGEGGAQLVRTAVALSAITGKRVRFQNVRAKRDKPGLAPQHLAAVRAVGSLCAAECTGLNPRRVVRIGLLALAAGALVLVAGVDPGADAAGVMIPVILLGCGMGALASQLGAVTVSAVPDERSAEVGGVQNTATNLGASLGTALIGSILIGSLTVAFITNIQNNPAVPPEVTAQASTQLASGVPFVSEAGLTVALNNAGVPAETATAIVQEYNDASLDALRTSMTFVAFFAIVALFFSGRIPNKAVRAS